MTLINDSCNVIWNKKNVVNWISKQKSWAESNSDTDALFFLYILLAGSGLHYPQNTKSYWQKELFVFLSNNKSFINTSFNLSISVASQASQMSHSSTAITARNDRWRALKWHLQKIKRTLKKENVPIIAGVKKIN